MYQSKRYQKPKSRIRVIASPKGLFVAALLIALAVVLAGGFVVLQNRDKPSDTEDAKKAGQVEPFNKSRYSLTSPASQWVIVNKKLPLNPKNYAPADLRAPNMNVESSSQQVNGQTATALESLAGAAASEGVNLILVSAYRSYDTQANIYDSMVRGYGQMEADRESARPGYSEHQTGWAADLGAVNGKCELKACFADTSEGKWLAANAHKFGFIIRYPEGKEHITGYMYEPWHLRYVGTDLAAEMRAKKILTLEEFFGLPAAPNY